MTRLMLVFVAFLLVLVLAACGSSAEEKAPTQEIAAATSTSKPVDPTDTPVPEPKATETVPPIPTEEPEPTATTAPTETPEPVEADECLACHMDKEQLIATAAQVEEVPSENSGVG